jgi:beta-lactamase superfamily II metal-dependent hydrolase
MERVIAVDLATVYDADSGKRVKILAWGDRVELTSETDDAYLIELTVRERQADGSMLPTAKTGRIKKSAKHEVLVTPGKSKVLKTDFVDVQQGDGAVIETPDGKVVLIDGGEKQLFARYLAGRYRGTSASEPKEIDCIVVSHGDADHFAGLIEIGKSESHEKAYKRLFIHPQRVFHNGIVKRTADRDVDQLGETDDIDGRLAIVELADDLRDVPDDRMSPMFKRWKDTLVHWAKRGKIEVARLERGSDAQFDFLREEGIEVEVLGPITISDDQRKGLPFLGEPKRRYGHPSTRPPAVGAPSASHTINGHSIVLRMTYRNWSMLFAGDLNEEAERTLADEHEARTLNLRSEVLKVPHHGSADFLFDFLEAVEPVVSVVSSGDEAPNKEYIHPRATLMAGLGRFGRSHEPVIFVTELVAFFSSEGWVNNVPPDDDTEEWSDRKTPFFAFSREAWGTVRVRTDGTRLLVYTDSGDALKKEAYVYTLDGKEAIPQEPIRV